MSALRMTYLNASTENSSFHGGFPIGNLVRKDKLWYQSQNHEIQEVYKSNFQNSHRMRKEHESEI